MIFNFDQFNQEYEAKMNFIQHFQYIAFMMPGTYRTFFAELLLLLGLEGLAKQVMQNRVDSGDIDVDYPHLNHFSSHL